VPSGAVVSLAARADVSWKGYGRPSGRSAISSPSNTAFRAGSAASAATTSGSLAVMSSSVRVNSRTRPAEICACTRMPSSFHSTAANVTRSPGSAAARSSRPAPPSASPASTASASPASPASPPPASLPPASPPPASALPASALPASPPPAAALRAVALPGPALAASAAILPSAASIEGALDASIGLSGCPTSSPNFESASPPPSSAASATAGSDPRSITARRTCAAGTPAARATASVITPSSAPWRSSPESRRIRKCCSSMVAAPITSSTSRFRSATEPGPSTAPISLKAASTPRTVSDGAAEAAGADRSDAHPTPICRCGSSPER
jgi:hypothetical protein